MAVFQFEALDNLGNAQTGLIHASDLVEARQKLRQKGMHIASLSEEADEQAATERTVTIPWLGAGKRAREVVIFARQLGTLVNAGVALVSALSSVEEQLVDVGLKTVIVRIRERVAEGSDFSECLRDYPKYFPSIFVNLVHTGELSGTLEQNLFYLADYLEKQQDFKNKFKTALYYPTFMLILASLIIFFLLTYLVPTLTDIFSDWGRKLPALTMGLIALSAFVRGYWYLLVGSLVLLVEGGRRLLQFEGNRLRWHRLKWRMPLWGELERKLQLATFCRTLGLLLHSQIPLLSGLELTARMIGNTMLASVVQQAATEVSQGVSLAKSLRQSRVVPPMVLQMIATGEASGKLENLLLKSADFYEKEVEQALTRFASLLEPILILVMAIIIGTAVVAIIMPIMELNQVIG